MKDYREMADHLFDKRNQYCARQKQLRQRMVRTAVPCICFCLVVAVGIAVLQKINRSFPGGNLSQVSVSTPISASPSPSQPSNYISSEDSMLQNSTASIFSPSQPESSIIVVPPPIQQPVLQLKYENINDLILDLRSLVGIRDMNLPNLPSPPPTTLPSIPGGIVSGDTTSSDPNYPSAGDGDITPPAVEVPPTADDPALPPSFDPDIAPAPNPGDILAGDGSSKDPEWDDPFSDPKTEEEIVQKEIWDSMFKDGRFRAPILGAGNDTYQLYQLEVTTSGLNYYYVDMTGSENQDDDYDLKICIPATADAAQIKLNQESSDMHFTVITIQSNNQNIEYCFVRSDDSSNHFTVYWTENKANPSKSYSYYAEYYGSANYQELKKLAMLLQVRIVNWD